VVEVSEMFQPEARTPSPTSSVRLMAWVRSLPVSVPEKLRLPGSSPTEDVRDRERLLASALEPPLRLIVWLEKSLLVEVPAVSVSVTVAVKEPTVEYTRVG
jgi:hypothetical protein